MKVTLGLHREISTRAGQQQHVYARFLTPSRFGHRSYHPIAVESVLQPFE
jgi:hypothetical protein